MSMEETRNAIELRGYQVVATTKHENGVSFDAHRIVGKRVLVHGPVGDDDDEAMVLLYNKILVG